MTDLGFLVNLTFFVCFRVHFWSGAFQHMIFSLCYVVCSTEITWTNNMTFQFDDVLWHGHISVLRTTDFDLLRWSSNMWGVTNMSASELVQTYEWKRQQTSSLVWRLEFFAKWAFLESFSSFKVENFWDLRGVYSRQWIFLFSCCFFNQKIEKTPAGMTKMEHFQLVGSKEWKNLRENRFHIETQKLGWSKIVCKTEGAQKVGSWNVFRKLVLNFIFCWYWVGSLEKFSAWKFFGSDKKYILPYYIPILSNA